MRTFHSRRPGRWLAGTVAVSVLTSACRDHVSTRPYELREGTFALALQGAIGRRHAALNESVTGTACRVHDYILLDNSTLSRRLSVVFPEIGARPVRYQLVPRGALGAAHAHLNLPVEFNQGFSLHLMNGAATVVKQAPDDVLGTIEGRLAQVYTDGSVAPESAFVRGAFRAKRCADWAAQKAPASRAP